MMERQALLEQKKQRLRELRQRRLVHGGDGNAAVDRLVNEFGSGPPKVPGGVSVAIQVDTVPIKEEKVFEDEELVVKACNEVGAKEVYKFDKGIQVSGVVSEKEVDKETPKEKEKEEETTKVENTGHAEANGGFRGGGSGGLVPLDEERLNKLIFESFKILNKILVNEPSDAKVYDDLGQRIKQHIESEGDGRVGGQSDVPIIPVVLSSPVSNRPIQDFDVSRHLPDLVAVSYGSNGHKLAKMLNEKFGDDVFKKLPGLVVIYNLKSNVMFPEYFLSSIAPVSVVRFDISNPKRVIGGLANGKLVIWDLLQTKSSKVSILPLLQSPGFSMVSKLASYATRDPINFIHHKLSICSVHQIIHDGHPAIISVSKDGVINLWSPHILAWPKVNSIQISKPQFGDENDPLSFKAPVTISKSILVQHQVGKESDSDYNGASALHEHNFINNLLLGCADGSLLKLTKNAKKSLIDLHLHENFDDAQLELNVKFLTCIRSFSFKGKEYYITSSLDWFLKIWSCKSSLPIASIPMHYVPPDFAVNPRNQMQLVTVGTLPSKTQSGHDLVLDIWDLNRKVLNPIFQAPILLDVPKGQAGGEERVTRIEFNITGDKIFLGLSNGGIIVWQIEEESLQRLLELQNYKIHEDFLSFINRHHD